MCHMFLVPVFETGSLRTFQLSPHTEAARARGDGGGRKETERHTKERRRGRDEAWDGWQRMRDRWPRTEDGWTDR